MEDGAGNEFATYFRIGGLGIAYVHHLKLAVSPIPLAVVAKRDGLHVYNFESCLEPFYRTRANYDSKRPRFYDEMQLTI
jgi:hypothetical protein